MDLEFDLEALQMLPEEQGLTGGCPIWPVTVGVSCGGPSCFVTCEVSCNDTCSYGTAME